MIPSLRPGTLLRQKYLIQKLLGQGGFGRTYLAIDLERFNEPCALKEFAVQCQGQEFAKSRELFKREAAVLHQLQHPQIPKFIAAFEEEQRLFLAQDLIAGSTYYQLLQARKRQGQVLSELEVLYLFHLLLPVLSYIHTSGVIHRDISPENIMLQGTVLERSHPQQASPLDLALTSGLPVMIDFGAVKEIAHSLCFTEPIAPLTYVGKAGYAPPEQLQTGRVYPHSDLYALAVTGLVLLTGQTPQALLDSKTLRWHWQSHVMLSEDLTQVLQKMLALQSNDRYQSAYEVHAVLEPLIERSFKTPPPTLNQFPLPTLISGSEFRHDRPKTTVINIGASLGQARTNTAYFPAASNTGAGVTDLMIKTRHDYWLGLGIGISTTLFLGLAAWLGWQLGRPTNPSSKIWVLGSQVFQSEASQIIGDGKNPAQLSNGQPRSIRFAPNEISASVRGNLQNHGMQPYTIQAAKGQIMTVTLDGAGVVMNVLRSDQQGIDSVSFQTKSWIGQLPLSDTYTIQVFGSGTYSLDVAVTPLSRPALFQVQRVKFALGKTGTVVTGTATLQNLRRYMLKAQAGQTLVIKVLQGNVMWSAIAPDGRRIGGSATNSKNWQGRVPMTGDYTLEVSALKKQKIAKLQSAKIKKGGNSLSSQSFALSLEIF